MAPRIPSASSWAVKPGVTTGQDIETTRGTNMMTRDGTATVRAKKNVKHHLEFLQKSFLDFFGRERCAEYPSS